MTTCTWFAHPGRAFWGAMGLAGIAGFGYAVGVHYVEGYTDRPHLAPAWSGTIFFLASLATEVGATRASVPARAPV